MEQLPILDQLCLPNYWSNRLSPETIVNSHIKTIEEANEIWKNIPGILDIPYGSNDREKLNLFGTDLSDDAPIFVYIPGGYWQQSKIGRESYKFLTTPMHKNGIKVILISYGQCPEMTLPEIVTGIEKAARWCINYAKAKNTRGLYFAGHCAGAHMIAMLFTGFMARISKDDQRFVKATILVSGLYDLIPVQKTCLNKCLRLDELTAEKMSPLERNISGGVETKFLFILPENESPEFVRQTKAFRNKVANLGYGSFYFLVKGVDHFDIIESMRDENFEVTRRIVRFIQSCCTTIDLDKYSNKKVITISGNQHVSDIDNCVTE